MAGARVALYSGEFAADPYRVYAALRAEYGDLAPVELAPGVSATLVLGHAVARRILHDPEHFPADPRVWQRDHLPEGSPVTAMMQWRPNALRSTGEQHRRYRAATAGALTPVDMHALHRIVEQRAVPLINAFAAMFDPTVVNASIAAALGMLIARKREAPGDDIASRLLSHPAGLDDTELLHQLVTIYAAGIEPGRNLIGNALRLILTDPQFAGDVLGGALGVGDAIGQVLFNDPPLANLCITYPQQPVLIGDTWLSAHHPVVISMAACNADPTARGAGNRLDGNRAHLAFSAGSHACPATGIACQIARDAVEQLLDALPEMTLAVPASELVWRPGPFHRALAALPVEFAPAPPLPVPV